VTQVKVYGRDHWLPAARPAISGAIQAAVVSALQYPPEKWVHRFFPMSEDDFVWGFDRSDRYTIVEVSMFTGRSPEAKRRLIMGLFANLQEAVGLDPNDLEITIVETPRENWGIRGLPGNEVGLDYRIDV
jgi:phenylpyruvate tautomerase PptA (4-oxalocrotonate tautomerase family)